MLCPMPYGPGTFHVPIPLEKCETAPIRGKMSTHGTARGWILTINNPNNDQINQDTMTTSLMDAGVSYAVWQLERVTTTHIQMYVHYGAPVRMTSVKRLFPTAHIEQRQGTVLEAITYCRKEESRVAGPYTYGVPPPGQGSRTDLDQLTLAIREGKSRQEIAEDMPKMVIRYHTGIKELQAWLIKPIIRENLVVTVYWGPTGVGKSHRVYTKYPDVYVVPVPAQRMWFDGYIGQSVVLFDDYRTDWMKPSLLLRLLDKWPMTVEFKGGMTAWTPTRIYITTDTAPELWFADLEALTTQILRRLTVIEHIVSR